VPLLPLHLLRINLATDGLPALALVMEPTAPDVLDRPPRAPGAPMLGRSLWRAILLTAALEARLCRRSSPRCRRMLLHSRRIAVGRQACK
jgi:magnesium-transporting ATPase (P-type)